MNLVDLAKHQGQRRKLIEDIAVMGIESKEVLEAMLKVPRHFFLDSTFENFAYQNKSFPIGNDQTISHPYTVAFQTEVLNIKQGEKTLEIGTGSGYQTAVLFNMGAEVYSIERHYGLFIKTKSILNKMRIKAVLSHGDGYLGLPLYAPFDKIIITAGSPEIPEILFEQLKIGGLMLVPLGRESHIMTLIIKTSKNESQKIEFDNFNGSNFRFVPMLKDKK